MAEEKKYVRTKLQEKQIESAIDIHGRDGKIEDAIFQHSVLCQTFFPYRDPGERTIWEHTQGNATLAVQALQAINPQTKNFEFVGIPYGAKARLISSYLNTKAIKSKTRIIDVADSMSGFIKGMGLNTDGHTFAAVKDQLRRLSNSVISLGYCEDGMNAKQVNFSIVRSYEFWGEKTKQPALWNSTIELSQDYFESLQRHAIPLDERALKALANNAMALDIYCWLTQRLHRIPFGKPQFVAWAALKEQFGSGYDRMDKFKAVFRKTLSMVKLQYFKAKIEEEKNKGFWLYNSPSPIEMKSISLIGLDLPK
ncbi:RepA protein [Cnuella takakiae]|uniref:RepA protein n=1 Tax=Cnuella takakiae TaxID=1302690 RepID=A0A1M5JBS6_9BACT|nr:replication protein RepA [Cnuella takakiae]OLY95610.1 hypothetical protein BUE76_00480 [Cnuella takakiae]SHG38007.1 RepA protein [Cnuella takakiae]